MNKIPPHIGWPLTIVGLLLLGVVWSFGVVAASMMDGGAQVVDNYYEKATRWDEQAALRQKSDALQWQISIELNAPGESQASYFVSVEVRDSTGDPVEGLFGEIRVWRPHQSEAVAVLPLSPDPLVPGGYLQLLPMATAGLWDFEIDARRDTLHFVKTIRKEFVL